MKTPNRTGIQLSQDLVDILNDGNRMIVECGCEKPGHTVTCSDYDDDGCAIVTMFTTKPDYDKMQLALLQLYAKLRAADYMSQTHVPCTSRDGNKMIIRIKLQHLPITVRGRKGAKTRVLTYSEYANRLYAAKLLGRKEVISVWVFDHQLPLVRNRYECIFCLQPLSLEGIQDRLDMMAGEGRYIAVQFVSYPQDRRRKPTFSNSFCFRESLVLHFHSHLGRYEVMFGNNRSLISNDEYERLKALGIPEIDKQPR